MVPIALFRVLVISGRRVLLKLCFQVFIVLSLPCAMGSNIGVPFLPIAAGTVAR